MPNNVDSIVDGFPHSTIPPILGMPSYATIAKMHLKLNTNAASVNSNLGNGQLGLLHLTITNQVYNKLSNVPFVVPVNPGAKPNIAANATGPQINAITRAFNKNRRIWREY